MPFAPSDDGLSGDEWSRILNSHKFAASEADLAVIVGPPVDFEIYRHSVVTTVTSMAKQYATIRPVAGRQVVVMSAVCDFDTVALPVADVFRELGAEVKLACAWCRYERLSSFMDVAPSSMTFIEKFDTGEVDIVFVASSAATTAELESMAITMLFDGGAAVPVAHVGVIVPVVARNSRMGFAEATLIVNDMDKLTWAYGALSDHIPQAEKATAAMLRMGFENSREVKAFPSYILEKVDNVRRPNPAWEGRHQDSAD